MSITLQLQITPSLYETMRYKDQRVVNNFFLTIKGIVSDFNNIFLWHESDDINKKKSLSPKFQLTPISRFQVMQDYACFVAPIDFCVD